MTGIVDPNLAGISDTNREAEEFQVKLLRGKTPAERLAIALRLSNEVADACKAAIRRTHPEYSELQVSGKFVELQYGGTLADELRRYLAARNRDEQPVHAQR